jgi:hypothetical protein
MGSLEEGGGGGGFRDVDVACFACVLQCTPRISLAADYLSTLDSIYAGH